MEKLINLNIYDAKNVICVWNENNDDFRCGIARDDSECGFMIPRHIVVGIFSDGSTRAAAIHSMNDVNTKDMDDLFMYDEFCYFVDHYAAKAFVRLELSNYGNKITESEACDNVYSELLRSGVEISEEARQYLTSQL